MASSYAQITWTNGNLNGLWSDPGNWSTNAVPTNVDDVIFDGTSTANCDIDVSADVNNLSILTGYTGTITDLGNGCLVNNDFVMDDGTYDAGSASFDVVGFTTITGGTFDANASIVLFGNDAVISGGTLNSGSGSMDFNGTVLQSGGIFNGNTASIGVNSTFTISAGTFNGNTSSILFVGDFLQSGGTFNSTAATATVEASNITKTGGTFNHNSGTFIINSTISLQTITINGSFTFNVLEVIAGAGTASNRNLNFNASVTTATLNLNASNKLFSYQGNINVTSALMINGTNTGSNVGNTGTITFSGAGPIAISGAGAAARNKLPNMTINTTGAVSITGHVNMQRQWTSTNIGSFTPGTSNVNFYGANGAISSTASNNAFFDNVSIQSASTLNIAAGSHIDLNGSLTHNGVYNGGTSLLKFTNNTAGAQLVNGTATLTTINAIEKTGNGSLAFSHGTNLLDSIKISGGAVTGTNLRLKSTASLKARVAEINGGGSLGGTITVETFIPGGTTDWAVLGASGVSGLTFNSWYGTIPMAIEGSTTGVTSAGGYFESVWRWDETDAFGYDSTVTVTDPINVGQGYWLYVGTSLSSSAPITTTVTGTPVTGSQLIPLSNSLQGGSCLIANPFASPISWDRIDAANPGVTTGEIHIYNADLGLTSSYVGGVSTPGGAGSATTTIPMGQGFYVVSTTGLPLSINEDAKVAYNTGADPLLKTNAVASVGSVVRLRLEGGGYFDETAIRFHSNGTAGFDNGLDARKYFDSPGYVGYPGAYNQRTTISTKGATGFDYSINSLPYALSVPAVIPVLAKVYMSGTHTISASGTSNLAPGTCVILKDKLLNVTQDLKAGNYICTINDTTSTARFELTICANITAGINNAAAATENVFVKQDANGVYVDLNFDSKTTAYISANNILGQQLMPTKQVECVSGKYYLDLNAKDQIIMVSVIANEKRTTKKIFIQERN